MELVVIITLESIIHRLAILLSSSLEQLLLMAMHVRILKSSLLLINALAVHCYGCDEEVEDEKLAEHLHNFGINIAKLQKTEKTVAELVYCF